MDLRKRHQLHQAVDRSIRWLIAGLVLLFILYPFMMVFKEALMSTNHIMTVSEMGAFVLANQTLIKNSLLVATTTSVLATILSVGISLYYFLAPNWLQKGLSLLFMITMISPPFVSSLAYIHLFGRRGFISHHLLHLTWNPYGAHGIIMMQTLGYLSLNTLLLIGFLKAMDKSVVETAQSLGANTNHILLDIILPLMHRGIIIVASLTFIRSLADFGTPSIIGGSFKVLATEGYLNVIARGNIQEAARINLLIFIPAMLVFILYTHYLKDLTNRDHGNPAGKFSLRRQGWLFQLVRVISILLIGALILQYLSIIMNGFTVRYQGKSSLSLANIYESRPYISSTFIRSIVYALIAGIVGSFLSFTLVYYSQVRQIKWMKWIDFIAMMPYIMPGTFFGLGYIFAFSKSPLKLVGTSLIVILNVTFKQLAFATKMASGSLSQINPELYQSTHDLGGSYLNELKDVVFPLSKEGLYVAFINGFTSTMTTIGSIIFLIYPSQKVATLVLFDLVQSGKYRLASVIACYIMLICLTANGVYYLVLKWMKKVRVNVSIR